MRAQGGGNPPTGTSEKIEADGELSPETYDEDTKAAADASPLSFTSMEEKLGKEKEMQKFLESEMFRTAIKKVMQEEVRTAVNKVMQEEKKMEHNPWRTTPGGFSQPYDCGDYEGGRGVTKWSGWLDGTETEGIWSGSLKAKGDGSTNPLVCRIKNCLDQKMCNQILQETSGPFYVGH
eukprot:g13517.t1